MRSRRKGLRSAVLKYHVARHYHWCIRVLPAPMFRLYLRLLESLAALWFRVPGNRLRESCEHVAVLAARAGYEHRPRDIYRAFLRRARGIFDGALCLYREGVEAAMRRIDISDDDIRTLQREAAMHGGVMIAVTHNQGSVFASARLAHAVQTLLVARNSPSVERTRIALDLFERLKVKILMVRDGNPFELSRACLRASREQTAIVASLDPVFRYANRVEVPVFGRSVGLNPWAARIAVKARIPVVPAYVHTRGEQVRVAFGEPKLARDVERAMAHYTRFWEQRILEDPASWSFLADKRWRRILAAAAAVVPTDATMPSASDAGSTGPARPRTAGAEP
jgi:lauroyl/myristoyl acyltransferase